MNNFGALRLFAAVLVLLGHSCVLAGQAAPRWFGVEVHNLAVHVFFVISGYLISGSWAADPSPGRYAARRALRIMPALAVVVVATVGLVGPAFTTLPLRAYAADPETRTYLWNLALAPFFSLPGVFQDGRPFTAVNGSLWSLPIEVAMYVAVPLLAARSAAVRRVVLPVLVVLAIGAAVTFSVLRPGQVAPVVYWSSIPFGLRYAGDFVLAAAIRAWRLERLLHLQAAVIVLAGLGLLPEGGVRGAALLIGLPYVVLSFGLARPALLPSVGRRTDLSYGIYLWGGPVQQGVLSVLGLGIGAGALFAVSLPLAAGLAWLSWWGVERPCLSLKPGRASGRALTDASMIS